jgi:hypothetical protein
MANCCYSRVVALVALGLLPCCGGTLSGPADAGEGVGGQTSAVGGAGSSIGGGGVGGQKPATGGANAAGSGGTVCCNGMPVCGNGDQEILSQDACPTGAECYSMSMCCSTIWCAKATAQCTAVPTCDSGDTQLLQGTCATSASCYERTVCGTTISCMKSATGACNPTTEYNRNYIATSTSSCQAVKFACPANTTAFFNSCGCGCEQDASCPQYVDCMPGPGTQDPLCSSTGANDRCPYTTRAM